MNIKESSTEFCLNYKISFSDFDKMLFVVVKILLFNKRLSLNDYEIIIDSITGKFELTNTKTKTIGYTILGKNEILKLRQYLVSIIKIVNSKELNLDQMYCLGLKNEISQLKHLIEKNKKLYMDENINSRITNFDNYFDFGDDLDKIIRAYKNGNQDHFGF